MRCCRTGKAHRGPSAKRGSDQAANLWSLGRCDGRHHTHCPEPPRARRALRKRSRTSFGTPTRTASSGTSDPSSSCAPMLAPVLDVRRNSLAPTTTSVGIRECVGATSSHSRVQMLVGAPPRRRESCAGRTRHDDTVCTMGASHSFADCFSRSPPRASSLCTSNTVSSSPPHSRGRKIGHLG